jgi:hypothetical protein
MLSYCSSEAAAKEERANSKANEIVVLALAPQEYATGPQERKLFTIYSNQAKQSSRDSPGF